MYTSGLAGLSTLIMHTQPDDSNFHPWITPNDPNYNAEIARQNVVLIRVIRVVVGVVPVRVGSVERGDVEQNMQAGRRDDQLPAAP